MLETFCRGELLTRLLGYLKSSLLFEDQLTLVIPSVIKASPVPQMLSTFVTYTSDHRLVCIFFFSVCISSAIHIFKFHPYQETLHPLK